jgi:SAM-dependent methyltransferase
MAKTYNQAFYEDLKSTSGTAARFVTPCIIKMFRPQSVLDVGCGLGEWLFHFHHQGIKDIKGVDGDYVKPEELKIPREKFTPRNLEGPFSENRKFDLVMSLEVAEHLSADAAEQFIDTLTKHGDLILFSAAVPGQVGTYHINEQWQSYWIEKFERRGYKTYDLIRPRFWNNPHVAWWYKQNAFIFMNAQAEDKHKSIMPQISSYVGVKMPKVHPEFDFFLKGKTNFIGKLFYNPGFLITNFLNKIRYKFFS